MRSGIIPGSGDINPASSPAEGEYYQVYPEVEHIVLDNECVMILNVLGYAPKSYDYPKAIHQLSILSSRSQINRDLVAFAINYLTLYPNFMDEFRLDNTGNDNRGFEIHELVAAGDKYLNWSTYEHTGNMNYAEVNIQIKQIVKRIFVPLLKKFTSESSTHIIINDYEALSFLAETFPGNEEIANAMRVLDGIFSINQIQDMANNARSKLKNVIKLDQS